MTSEQGCSSTDLSDPAPAQSQPTSDGAAVLQEVVQMTGLPEAYLNAEFSTLLGTPGEGVNQMSLDQLRLVLLNYLETLNEEITLGQDHH